MHLVSNVIKERDDSIANQCPGYRDLVERYLSEFRAGHSDKAEATWAEATRVAQAFKAGGEYVRAKAKLHLTAALGEPVVLKSTLERIAREIGVSDA